MVNLAELSEDNICVGTKSVISYIDDGRHIIIENPDYNYYVFRKYDKILGAWSQDIYKPEYLVDDTSLQKKLELIQNALDDIILGGM